MTRTLSDSLRKQAAAALTAARPYLESAKVAFYDGTGGHGIRAEASRRLVALDAALAALSTGGEPQPVEVWHDPDTGRSIPKPPPCSVEDARKALGIATPLAPQREPQPSAQGPAELWLQLHGDCSAVELDEPVDYTSGEVTWCWHPLHDTDVRYVRADLVRQEQAAPQGKPQPVIGHLHSNGDFCCERMPEGVTSWPVSLYATPKGQDK